MLYDPKPTYDKLTVQLYLASTPWDLRQSQMYIGVNP
uniref:Uncharacterized protein n=1 Tax=Rhizophora mucronata TaxID=61149 RepID=A0A2P2Q4N0_RHIMU